MNRKTAMLCALVLAMGALIILAQQNGRSFANYTNASVALGKIDAAAVDSHCTGMKGHRRLVCLADALKKGLGPDLTSKLQLPYSVEDAQKWSNFPPAGYRNRIGPTLGEFTPAQLVIIKAMLKEATGIAANEGYDEIEQILNADDYLKENAGGRGRGGFASGNFHLAFLGTPADRGIWQLYFGGHHLAFGTTYKDGVLIGATPSFRGVEPFSAFTQNGRENQPMVQEQRAFAAMLGGLRAEQQSKARLSQTYTDIIVGPQKDNTFPSTHAGVRTGDLTRQQQDLILRAIETYVRDIDPPDAEAILKKYRSELPETYVAYAGTVAMNTENDYVRIDGPSVWIELSMQPGRSLPGIHPHSVWRDRTTDYGGNGSR
jgi:Protein of unknown function (DUF3500)